MCITKCDVAFEAVHAIFEMAMGRTADNIALLNFIDWN
jgi:hypothetical protein